MSHAEPPPRNAALQRKLRRDEVARHATESDCWLIVKGRVYDVTHWAAQHPGGRVLYAHAGRDATEVFAAFHPPSAYRHLAPLCIGVLDESEPPSELLVDFRKLRSRLHREGLFKSNAGYYAIKVASTFALLALSIAALVGARGSVALLAVSTILLGLFWQQCGWLAHDFCHHQVFEERRWNDVLSYFLGNLCQGFSVDWWKSKHNLHHASPNELAPTFQAIDPDIDTLPLLAWSDAMLEIEGGARMRPLVRVQHYVFFPVLLLARFNWAIGSVVHAARLARASRRGVLELAVLAVHYAWHFGLVFALLPWRVALVYAVASQVASGLLLAIVFVQAHNGMEVPIAPKDFVSAQLATTRNMSSTAWNDWFTGGLNHQIEHHLFPTLPRHNLAKVREHVRELCARHGLDYEECGMATSTARVLRCLASVASRS